MSMPALFSALRGAGRQRLSASTIAARQVTGTHVLRIDGYNQVKKMVLNGVEMRSSTFTLGGHDWLLSCYPNGWRAEYDISEFSKGHISVFLQHASYPRTGEATAKAQVSILDKAWKPCYTRDLPEHHYSEYNGLSQGEHIAKHKDLDAEKHLKDDCLTILCDVTVTEHLTKIATPESTVVKPPFRLHDKHTEAIWNKERPDVTIQVGGETFAAHRWILEAQSPLFKADLSLPPTTAGDDDTAPLLRLRVDDMDAEVFRTLLQFMYTNSAPETNLLGSATTAGRLLVAADRYELEGLKVICEEALCRHIDMSSVAAALALAERHDCSVLKGACMQFLSSPGNLEAFMAADGFKQLKRGCPSALVDLLVEKMARREQ